MAGEKLANRELFAKIFLTNIHRYTENVFGICTDCSLFSKFFSANSFYLYGSPKFVPAKYFPCMMYRFVFTVVFLHCCQSAGVQRSHPILSQPHTGSSPSCSTRLHPSSSCAVYCVDLHNIVSELE